MSTSPDSTTEAVAVPNTPAATGQEANNSLGPLEDKILRQIEYYFGDRNLPRDKFLQQAVANGEDGYVPIATLLTFNRLKALSSNEALIGETVKKGDSSIVQLSEDGTAIRRHPDKSVPDIFAPDLRKVIKSKTVYAKGFPETVTLDSLQTFFGKYGEVEHIHMRRLAADQGRKFKGSVFVEYKCKESADSFLTTEGVEFEGVSLVKESKEDYFQRKITDKKAKKSLPTDGEDATPVAAVLVKEKNTVLHFNGCGEKPTWESMKEALNEHATVAFVDFANDERTEGYVRFKDEGGATRAVEGLTSAEGGAVLLGAPTVVRVLEGDEELQYWTKLEANKKLKASGGKGRAGYKRKARHDYRPRAHKQAKTGD